MPTQHWVCRCVLNWGSYIGALCPMQVPYQLGTYAWAGGPRLVPYQGWCVLSS